MYNRKQRILYLDVLNIFACFAVLMLHHNGIVHNYNVNSLAWKQALMFEVLFYWAVPIFFMLTGATLVSYREQYSTKVFFTKRFLRTVIPFLIWSIILLIYSWWDGSFPYKNITEVFNAIITTKIPNGNIYWFFIPLFSLYCFIPVLSLLKDYTYILWYMGLFIFITHSCLPILFNLLGFKYNFAITFPTNGYVLFLLLGFLFSKINLTRKQRISIYVLGIISVLIRYVGTYHYSLQVGKVDKWLFNYMHFHSVLLALAVFVFIKQVIENTVFTDRFSKVLYVMSSCSLGIYLIHHLIMSIELVKLGISADNFYWRFFGAFLTYLICFIIVFLVKKIPYIRSVFP
ncbi:acyltransferase [Haemophilus haemolyticus]|uniref:Acyltransferase n=1 Tax=Haemophilus haemolyticus TaxID=726 RepID=A0A502LI41_HAEHA|nr:acyltransferase [Haemophilus haemolyticus]TPH23496.1 acyltransferase [Haemophilus haemolyticus]